MNKQQKETIELIKRMYDLDRAITLFLRKNLQFDPGEVFLIDMKHLLACEIGALGRCEAVFFKVEANTIAQSIKLRFYTKIRSVFTKLRSKLKTLARRLFFEKAE